MSKPKLWTTEQIKAAFWSTFHQQGEFWFPYPGRDDDPEYGLSATKSGWNDFMENLHEQDSLRVYIKKGAGR